MRREGSRSAAPWSPLPSSWKRSPPGATSFKPCQIRSKWSCVWKGVFATEGRRQNLIGHPLTWMRIDSWKLWPNSLLYIKMLWMIRQLMKNRNHKSLTKRGHWTNDVFWRLPLIQLGWWGFSRGTDINVILVQPQRLPVGFRVRLAERNRVSSHPG